MPDHRGRAGVCTPSHAARMLFEIGAMLVAALSIAFVGNILANWLGS
jgi:hypothetical protein